MTKEFDRSHQSRDIFHRSQSLSTFCSFKVIAATLKTSAINIKCAVDTYLIKLWDVIDLKREVLRCSLDLCLDNGEYFTR